MRHSLASGFAITDRLVMRRTLIRACVILLAATVTLVGGVIPAFAGPIPSGVGWSASWVYTSPTTLTVAESTNHASFIAHGTDINGVRSYTASLTDSDHSDGVCAMFQWDSLSFEVRYWACNTTITFTIPAETITTGYVIGWVCSATSFTATWEHCNDVEPPASASIPNRMSGTGFAWTYANTTAPYNWRAYISDGIAVISVYGINNYGAPGFQRVHTILSLATSNPLDCGSAQMNPVSSIGGPPGSSGSVCGGSTLVLPDYTTDDNVYGVPCSWAAPFPKSCLTQSGDVTLPH
jgi:hypothetical protein